MSISSGISGAIRIGTRASQLARWQSDWVAEQLRKFSPGLKVELVEIKTQGDRDRNTPLGTFGDVGLFTKEIQRAVCDGLVDVAVHSLKDLPTQGPRELVLAAVPVREDVADALIAPAYGTIHNLCEGARVGTSSPRRRAQLLYLRPDLRVESLRGNVETRLNQALDGTFDAIVLAWAGLHRLGLAHHVTQRLDPCEFLPAVGQGALGIECRSDDLATIDLLKLLDDPVTHRAVLAERSVLASLEGGCSLPLAAWARDAEGSDDRDRDAGVLAIDTAVFDFDGSARIAATLQGPRAEPERLGLRAAETLRAQGAVSLLQQRARPGDRF
jgi:hydroxymethylbilane synthase